MLNFYSPDIPGSGQFTKATLGLRLALHQAPSLQP
jgi:hypothetical protein